MMNDVEIEEWTEEEILQLQEKLEEAMRVSIEYKEKEGAGVGPGLSLESPFDNKLKEASEICLELKEAMEISIDHKEREGFDS